MTQKKKSSIDFDCMEVTDVKVYKFKTYLMDCGVKISPNCCELMKERPMRDYEKMNGKSPIIGTRAEESFRRAVGWMKSGCNSFAGNRAKSTPLSLWVESDVLRYIDENCINVSPMYTEGGMKRTGCMFCPVPIAHGDLTSIEYARTHHPKIYETMMIKHGLKSMLDKAKNHNGQLELFNG